MLFASSLPSFCIFYRSGPGALHKDRSNEDVGIEKGQGTRKGYGKKTCQDGDTQLNQGRPL